MSALPRDAGFTLRQVDSSIGANVGTGTHTAVAHFLREKMKTGRMGDASAAEDAGIASLHEEAAKGVTFDATTPDISTGEQNFVRGAHLYCEL